MTEPQAASQWHEVRAAWAGLGRRIKLAAGLALLIALADFALAPESATFATGPAVLLSVAFAQWGVALAGPARLLVGEAPAAELARARAPVLVALGCALPGWVVLCFHGGIAVGLLCLGLVALEILVLRHLRRAVRR